MNSGAETSGAKSDGAKSDGPESNGANSGRHVADVDTSPSPVDGNAAAGALAEIFAIDVTVARGRCDNCGAVGQVAETVVYRDAPGLVVRCRSCSAVLLRLVESTDRLWLDVRGLSYLEVARAT